MYTIGFANLTEQSQFAVTVRESLESAVAQREDMQIIHRDNALNDDVAFANARYFAEENVDLAIIFHINERIGMELQSILRPIPVLTIDIPFPLAPHFGINNAQSGRILGQVLVDWVRTRWAGDVDYILALVDSRVIVLRDRIEEATNILLSHLEISKDQVFYLDCGNDRETTLKNSIQVLKTWQDCKRIGVITFNAESTFGLLEAATQTDSLDKLAIVANAADHLLLDEIHQPNTHVIATSYYDPADYGEQIIQLVEQKRAGQRLPPRTLVDMVVHIAEQPFDAEA